MLAIEKVFVQIRFIREARAEKDETASGRWQALEVSNLDKVFYPGKKFTKADVIDYYVRISK